MKMRSKTLGVIIVIVIFGGIMGASALGLWRIQSSRAPALARTQVSESVGETAGQAVEAYDPAGIRGSHRFGEISEWFDIPLETLARAFALPADVDPSLFKTQYFDTIYPEFEGEEEIGNGSMKWFVALYTGLPFELEEDEEATYLLRPAVDILKSQADLSAEQIAYLDAYTIEMEPVGYSPPEDEPQSSEERDGEVRNVGGNKDEMVVAGQTNFADLLNWGVPVEQIEAIIGGEIPNRLMSVRDYCTENELSFGETKADLQAEVDKLIP